MYTPSYFSIDKEKVGIDQKELKRRLSVSGDFDVSVYEKAVRDVLAESTPKACFIKVPVVADGDEITFPFVSFHSRDLSKNLSGCKEAFVFAVTLGHGVERLLSKISRLSSADFFIYDAVGSALAESVCDIAENMIKGNIPCKPRFSPGYGDLPLSVQRDVLSVLNAEKLLGITLTETNLMIPQKSITAILAVSEEFGMRNAE